MPSSQQIVPATRPLDRPNVVSGRKMVSSVLIMLASLWLIMAGPTYGQALNCQSSERFGQKLLNVGDPERKVIELEPDRTVQLETRFGGAAGYRFDFYKRGRTVQIYVRSGVVIRICRVPD